VAAKTAGTVASGVVKLRQMRLHDGEIDIDAANVRRLLAEQFPDLARLDIREVHTTGTVNRIFRVGQELYARIPRTEEWASDLGRESRLAAELAPHLPLPVPEQIAAGVPGAGYPFQWAIYRWLDGEPYADDLVDDEVRAAADLAGFVRALRAAPFGASVPRGGRRPLADLDQEIRVIIEALRSEIDVETALAAWSDSVSAPVWDGPPVWVHADLLRPNVLVHQGRVAAVIDFGMAGAGDPAADAIAGWTVFGRAGRAAYRDGLGVDDATWRRARGYALVHVMGIGYYRETNPGFAALARRSVREVLTEFAEKI
jgi:aminoglycoside phosphotransferase (APT) family kinase protein